MNYSITFLFFFVDSLLNSALRCSNYNLMIEYGRRLQLERKDRLCPFCVIPTIESELHFCLECPFYEDLRSCLIQEFYYTFPSINKLNLLFTSRNTVVIRNLAKFVFLAMKKREKHFECG